jgi:hypothetical protein
MYTLSFVQRFSCPNPPKAEERGQVLLIVYFLKFSQSTVYVLKFFENVKLSKWPDLPDPQIPLKSLNPQHGFRALFPPN